MTHIKDSKLWQSLQENKNHYPLSTPSGLHSLHHMLFVSGNGYCWSNGILASEYTLDDCRVELPVDDPYIKSSDIGTVGRPEENQLFNLIPAVPDGQFLSYRPSDAFGGVAENQNISGSVSSFHCIPRYWPEATNIPYEADINYLAAETLMLRHIWQHPERLSEDDDKESRHRLVGKTLNACFEIVEKRGLKEDFARACGELTQALPEMVELSDKYVEKQREMFRQSAELKARLENLTPEKREEVEKLVKEVFSSLKQKGPSL